MKNPKISIVTVVFNNKEMIASAVDSVLSQTYRNIEYIIVDGGSTDGTAGIIKSYGKKIGKYISEPDKGIYDAMNKGIKLATGDIVGVLNSDDMFYDKFVVEDIAKTFVENDADCVYGDLVYVDRNDVNKVTRRWDSCAFKSGLFEKSWTPAHPTFYCKRELFERLGYYRLDFKIAADVDLMFRFLEIAGISSRYIPRMMVKMRDCGVSNTGLSSAITITKEMRQVFMENGRRFNLLSYLFHKALKIRQKILK
ncbi:MAG: glycosyltransferase family 2 protein [Candidatus Saganbacteria bacterium]|nr:glycosyltransferase family 2 protein [Candidatus Saganbacteria bacterium]